MKKMGILGDLFRKIRDADDARESIDDEQTTDRYLRSLRRQRRKQLEEFEKEDLKKQIKEHEKMRTREVVLGTAADNSDIKKRIIKKKIQILKEKQFMIPKKKPQNGFFGRGKI